MIPPNRTGHRCLTASTGSVAIRTSRASLAANRLPRPRKSMRPAASRPIGPRPSTCRASGRLVRCARCGNELMAASAWSAEGTCNRCGADLHTCAQCAHFDTSAAYECQRPIKVRVSPKDARNTCTEFEPRTTVERETKSVAPTSARKAFDDLFK